MTLRLDSLEDIIYAGNDPRDFYVLVLVDYSNEFLARICLFKLFDWEGRVASITHRGARQAAHKLSSSEDRISTPAPHRTPPYR